MDKVESRIADGHPIATAKTVAQVIASLVQARAKCERAGNDEWAARHAETVEQIVRDFMPSGSGWDRGTALDWDKSNSVKLVFTGSYRHMNESGMYDGWTDHSVIVQPDWDGVDISVSGRDRNGIKDYINSAFDIALCQRIRWQGKLGPDPDTRAGEYVSAK